MEDDSEFTISPDQESWIVSLDNLATPVICIVSGCLQQKFGPRRVLLFSCFPYFAGWLICSRATAVGHLYVSRVLVGVSHALVTTSVYLVEIASKEMRGTFSLWESVLRCAGCLATYTLGFFLRWQQIATFAPIVPLLAFLACLCVPESPVFLLKRREVQLAERAIRKLYGKRYRVGEEIEIIQQNLDELRDGSRKEGVWKRFANHPEVYKPFGIIVTLSVIQQFSGMSILRYGYIYFISSILIPKALFLSEHT